MKKLLFTILTTSALTASLFAAQNEKFTGKDNWITGGAVFTIKPSATFSIANAASAPQVTRAFVLGAPALIVTNRFVATTALLKTGLYTLANTAPDVPRNVVITTTGTHTGVVTATITGTDISDAVISEILTVPATATTVTGVKAFKTIKSIEGGGAGTVDSQTVIIGTGNLIGLPVLLANGTKVLATTDTTIAVLVGSTSDTILSQSSVTGNSTVAYDGSRVLTVYIVK